MEVLSSPGLGLCNTSSREWVGKNGKDSNLQGYLLKPAIRGKVKSFAGMRRNHERPEVLERETSYSVTPQLTASNGGHL